MSQWAAYRYRFYPTEEQEILLVRTFGCVRFVYNHILKWRNERYRSSQTKTPYEQASAYLTELKEHEGNEFLKEVSCVPLQQSLRHQQQGYRGFRDGRTGFPTTKKRRDKQSAEFTKSAFSWDPASKELTIAKCETPLNIRMHRQLPAGAEPTTVTITKEKDGRWYCSMRFEFDPTPMEPTERVCGFDMGVADTLVASNGWHSGPSPTYDEFDPKIRRRQKELSRQEVGSNNWKRTKQKLNRLYARQNDKRRDRLHKLSHKIVSENQTICLEDLSVAHMLQGAYKELSARLSDASLGELRRMIAYKAEWYGREVVFVDRYFPSTKMCSECGHVVAKIPLNVRNWTCPACKAEHLRDLNAAKNILAAGLVAKDCGDDVRHIKPTGECAIVSEAVSSGRETRSPRL